MERKTINQSLLQDYLAQNDYYIEPESIVKNPCCDIFTAASDGKTFTSITNKIDFELQDNSKISQSIVADDENNLYIAYSKRLPLSIDKIYAENPPSIDEIREIASLALKNTAEVINGSSLSADNDARCLVNPMSKEEILLVPIDSKISDSELANLIADKFANKIEEINNLNLDQEFSERFHDTNISDMAATANALAAKIEYDLYNEREAEERTLVDVSCSPEPTPTKIDEGFDF